jgi:hypothetical protein
LGDWLLVYGLVAADLDAAAFTQVQRVDRIANVPPRPPGTLSIRLLGDGAVVLADYFFAPVAQDDAVDALGFGHVVPFVAGTRTVQIVDTLAGNAVLASRQVSSNAPVVVDVVAQSAPGSDVTALSWGASDADGDPLTFDVYLARDGGASLQALMVNLSGTSAEVDTASLGGRQRAVPVIAKRRDC